MLQPEDHVYYALLWKKPQNRVKYLEQHGGDKSIELLETIVDTVGYPKLYNTSLAIYAAFVGDVLVGLFPTRDEAWKAGGEHDPIDRVVDVPRTELENPRYDIYYSEHIYNE